MQLYRLYVAIATLNKVLNCNAIQPSQLNSFAVILKIWGSPQPYWGSKEVIGRTVPSSLA